jgi:hypothetical protein
MLVRLLIVAKIACADSVRLSFWVRSPSEPLLTFRCHCFISKRQERITKWRGVTFYMKGSASHTATTTPKLATVYKFAEVHMTPLVLNYLDNLKTSEIYTETWKLCALFFSLTFLKTLFSDQYLVNLEVYMCRNAHIHRRGFFFMAQQTLLGQGFLIIEVSRSQTHQTRYESSGRVIDPSQTHLPADTQYWQEIDIMPTEENEPAIPAGERPQTYALDRAATGTGTGAEYVLKLFDLHKNWNWNFLKIHSQVFVLMRMD